MMRARCFLFAAALALAAGCARSTTSNPETTTNQRPALMGDTPDSGVSNMGGVFIPAPDGGVAEFGAIAPIEEADGGKPKGRLLPEVIQKVVRENYGIFRKCYEQGLARDPNLEGNVTVRFVIELDGKVSNAMVAPQSTMSDKKVVDCVLDGYRQLVFPKPSGGTVTVVYPIMFSPG